jgi:hypothetical protein
MSLINDIISPKNWHVGIVKYLLIIHLFNKYLLILLNFSLFVRGWVYKHKEFRDKSSESTLEDKLMTNDYNTVWYAESYMRDLQKLLGENRLDFGVSWRLHKRK